MQTIKAETGDRLDQITLKYYDTLEVYAKIIEANEHLMPKVVLEDGDIVNLPTLTIEKKEVVEVKTLW